MRLDVGQARGVKDREVFDQVNHILGGRLVVLVVRFVLDAHPPEGHGLRSVRPAGRQQFVGPHHDEGGVLAVGDRLAVGLQFPPAPARVEPVSLGARFGPDAAVLPAVVDDKPADDRRGGDGSDGEQLQQAAARH